MEDITLRHTVIKDFENRRVVIPNSVISNEVILNSTIEDEKICVLLEFPVSYQAALSKVFEISERAASAHPYYIDNRNEDEMQRGEKPVMVRVTALNELSVQVRVSVWAKNAIEAFIMKCDLMRTIKDEMTKAGIEAPYPQGILISASKKFRKNGKDCCS